LPIELALCEFEAESLPSSSSPSLPLKSIEDNFLDDPDNCEPGDACDGDKEKELEREPIIKSDLYCASEDTTSGTTSEEE